MDLFYVVMNLYRSFNRNKETPSLFIDGIAWRLDSKWDWDCDWEQGGYSSSYAKRYANHYANHYANYANSRFSQALTAYKYWT